MKIHSVSITGFGPYRGTETVDFDEFADDGMFLITGKTGAGKSSIFDAISYALFGRIPRFEGNAGEHVRSGFLAAEDGCEVVLVFTAAGTRYRISRVPEHQRPGRKNPVGQKVELARWDGRNWHVLESQVRNAALRVDEIVRLNAEQFGQVILLAQGKFQEFLLADSATRREVLRTLFGTKRFDDYSGELDARAKSMRAELERASESVRTNVASLERLLGIQAPPTVDSATGSGVAEWLDELTEQQRGLVHAAEESAATTQQASTHARSVLDASRIVAERQARRADALRSREALAAANAAIADVQAQLRAARQADLAWQPVLAARAAAADLVETRTAQQAALARFSHEYPAVSTDPASLRASIDDLAVLLGSLQDAVQDEERLADLAQEAERSEAAVAVFDAQVAASRARRATLREERDQLETLLAELEDAPARLASTQAELASLTTQLAAATRAATTESQLQQARRAQLEAGKLLTAASARRDHVRELQLVEYAGVLAVQLTDGEACAVCGSTEHPAPAALPEDHITEADIAAADTAFAAAVDASRAAGETVSALQAQHAAECGAAGNKAVAELTDLVAEAAAATELWRSAATQLDAGRARVAELQTSLRDAAEVGEQEAIQRAELLAAVASQHDELHRLTATVANAHAEHPSVTHRVQSLQAQLTAGRALLEVSEELGRAEARVGQVTASLATVLAESGFCDADAVEAVRLPAAEQTALQARISKHEAAMAAVEATLGDPALADLPEQPVDLSDLQAALTAAETAERTANSDHAQIRAMFKAVAGLAHEIRQTLAAAAQARAEYDIVNGLASAVRGQPPNTMKMTLETFVLAAELEQILAAANPRLRAMTDGRFEFRHSDALAKGGAQSGLALEVLDAHTGAPRPVQSLSGGQQFQASLALALGLAEVVTHRAGGMTLDTLFIDEGFGSLDAETLETTMATLDSLREGGRTIGVISHVEAMKESIAAKLYVDTTDGGWSTIRRSA